MNTPNSKNNPKLAFFSLKLLNEKLKNYDVFFTYREEEGGNVFGTYKGVKKVTQSNKKITNQDLMNLIVDMKKDIDKRFEDMETKFEKRFEDMETKFEKRFDKIDAKIDLIIACPTIQSEIDHESLAKIDAR